jgi:hypothetical protein
MLYDLPKRRAAESARRGRRARRIIATLVFADLTLFGVVLLVLLFLTFKVNHALLLLVHFAHLPTILLGSAVVYHTAYAYDILRWLMPLTLFALVGDLFVIMIRIIILAQLEFEGNEVEWEIQKACLGIACMFFLFVDLPLAYFADEMRSHVIAPLDDAAAKNAADYRAQQQV